VEYDNSSLSEWYCPDMCIAVLKSFCCYLCLLNCVYVRCAPVSDATANSGTSWHKYGVVRTVNTEDGKTAVEFEPDSHNVGVHRTGGKPSLAKALFRTFFRYFAWSQVLLLAYTLIMFINPFLLK